MFYTKDERGNIIYHFKPLNEIYQNSNIIFEGEGNVVFLCENVLLNNSQIYLCENENVLFIAHSTICADITLLGWSLCYIGNRNFLNPYRTKSRIELAEHKNLIIGDDNLISWVCEFENFDWHYIYDSTGKRINKAKSIYIGDHCWIGQNAKFLKGAFLASGVILGARSICSNKTYHSNAIYAGAGARKIREQIFWGGGCPIKLDKEALKEFDTFKGEAFLFSFEKDKFLDPQLIEKELETIDNPLQKLEFVYDFIYNNTHKNRFALLENSDLKECKLYKDESKIAFKSFEFQPFEANFKENGAVLRVKNSLSYQLGLSLKDRSFKKRVKLPFILIQIVKNYKAKRKNSQANLQGNFLKLEDFADYEEALRLKNSAEFRLGNALVKAFQTWHKGGLIKFFFRKKF